MANLIRYIPTQTLMFAVKHTIATDIASRATDCNKFQQSCIAGAIAGAVSLGALYPLDLARNRLTLDTYMRTTPHRLYDGLRDVYVKTWRAEGVTGLYRGLFVSLAGVVVYRGLFFGLYDHFKVEIFGDNVGYLASFVVGYGR
jgi:solute carrier family 25 (adenine nucleotide translocator) protein 4/5/6/31